jgi:hypothetical protein
LHGLTSFAVLLFLEKYGWFVLLGIAAAVVIWSKLAPYWRKWKEKHAKKREEKNIGKSYKKSYFLRYW